MKKFKFLDGFKQGLLAPLTGDISKNYICFGEDNSLSLINYSDGSLKEKSESFYFIFGIKNIDQSDFIITAEDTLLNIYLASKSLNNQVFQYEKKLSIRDFDYNQVTNEFYIVGPSYGEILEITEPQFSSNQCHSNCESSCTKAFSSSSCNACKPETQLKDGLCQKISIEEPLGGKRSENIDWGIGNVVKIEEEESTLSGTIKFALIFFGILIFVVGYCICRAMCRKITIK